MILYAWYETHEIHLISDHTAEGFTRAGGQASIEGLFEVFVVVGCARMHVHHERMFKEILQG